MDGRPGAKASLDPSKEGVLDGVVGGDSGFLAPGSMGSAAGFGEISSTMIESSSTTWTDEKHSSFLNSIEASFVDQMYGQDAFKNWKSRKQDQELVHHPFSDQADVGDDSEIHSKESWIQWRGTSSDQHHYCSGLEVSDQNFVEDQTRSEHSSREHERRKSRKRATASGNQEANFGSTKEARS